MHGQVFCSLQDRDDVLPSFVISFFQSSPHLADGLSREEEAPARVVEDLASQLQLATGPRDHLLSGMCLQLFGMKNFHVRTIVGQDR